MFRMFRSQSVGLIAVAVVSALGSSGCAYFSAASQSPAPAAADEVVIPITVGKTEAREVPAVIQATGTLVADVRSNVAPKVAGKVSDIAVNAGDFVTQGSLLAKIDDRDARLDLIAAQAAVKQAQAAVRQAEARLGLGPNGRFNASSIPEVRAADANYQLALAELRQAEANEKRYRELVETGDVAMIAYEQFRTTRDTARARANSQKELLDAAVNNARQNNEAIRTAEANVEAARARVATAQQAITDTVVRAPFAGFISERQVAVGEFVSTATVIVTLMRTNPIKIEIQVAETDIPTVALGQGVSMEVDAYRSRRFAGTVTAVNPAVDAASRSAIVEASIQNNENALRPGMFATARINQEGGSTGVFAPKAAVYENKATQSYRAFVIIDGTVKIRDIQLGPEEGEYVQILSGLNADEIVAVSNLAELYEGARVAF